MFTWRTMLDGELIDRWAGFCTRDVSRWQGIELSSYEAAKAACREELIRRGFRP